VGRLDVTVLDGDEMRTQLGGELGFSKADRELNCHRMAYIASEITKVGGIVLCALIAPYQESRLKMRQNITQYGGFIEIYVATPMSICQKRDTKGLYKKATSGELHALTGVSDPYEAPRTPELVIDTSLNSIQHSMDTIMQYLLEHGVLQTRHKYEETA
jgi:sulfate adenylyltransferase